MNWVEGSRTVSGHYDTNFAQSRPSSRYFYDGQMGFEDDYNPSGSITKINRYALGARGIDRIEHYESNATTHTYPIYDGHGNMRAVLSKSGSSPYYTTANWKAYDVWGSVRSGSSSGDPKQRYVANLGHVADDETGLTYMRARYYEPSTGRFISQDPAIEGWNWFSYCSSDPVNRIDSDGRWDRLHVKKGYETAFDAFLALAGLLVYGAMASLRNNPILAVAFLHAALFVASAALGTFTDANATYEVLLTVDGFTTTGLAILSAASLLDKNLMTGVLAVAYATWSILILGGLLAIACDEHYPGN